MAAVMALLLSTAAAAMPQTLVAVGRTVGIRLETDGILVAELEPGGPAEQAGLRSGDVIETVNGTEITSCEQFQSMLQSCDGGPLDLAIERNGKDAAVTVAPTRSAGGCHLGVSVRDSMAGIGTVTYYDPTTGAYGALGHGVNDFAGLGAAVAVYGDSDVVIEDSTIATTGVAKAATFADSGADLIVRNSSLSCAGGDIYPEY